MELSWTKARGLLSSQSLRKFTTSLSEEQAEAPPKVTPRQMSLRSMPGLPVSHTGIKCASPKRSLVTTKQPSIRKIDGIIKKVPIESPPAVHPDRVQVAVLGSTEIELDTQTIMQLFPDKFEVKEQSQDSVTLEEKKGTGEKTGGVTILILDCKASRAIDDIPAPMRYATLVVDETEIMTSMGRCYSPSVALVAQETVGTWKDDFARLAVLRMRGGGHLVLMTPLLLVSEEGRRLYTKTAMSSTTGNRFLGDRQESFRSTLTEDSFLNDIEGEFSIRRKGSSDSIRLEGAVKGDKRSLFPSLSLSMLTENGLMKNDVRINTRRPIAVETELFVGKMVVIMRPRNPADDSYYDERVFSKSKTTFIFQLQGRFRQEPRGTVYAGVELAAKADTGVMAQVICGLLLRKLQKTHPDCHYSYGDINNSERPHIVMPASTFFDRMIVTRSPDVPPPLDKPFPESASSIASRKSSGSKGDWNTRDTYSLAFFSSNIDFSAWELKGLDTIDDISLRRFCRDSPIRLVLYERSERDMHLHEYNKYIFALQVNRLDAVDSTENEVLGHTKDDDVPLWDKVQNHAMFDEHFVSCTDEESQDETDVGVGEQSQDDLLQSTLLAQRSLASASKDLLAKADTFCPAWIDMIAPGGNTYTSLFAFSVHKGTKTVFRTETEFTKYFDTTEAEREALSCCSPRLSSKERDRRVLGLCLSSQHGAIGGVKLRQFSSFKAYYDSKFLHRTDPDVCPDGIAEQVAKSGYAARALGDRHWREELLRLVGGTIYFFHPGRQIPNFRIHLRTIVNAKRLDETDTPNFPQQSFLSISTVGRTTYLMFATDAERDDWASVLEAAGVEGDNLTDETKETLSVDREEGEDSDSTANDFEHIEGVEDEIVTIGSEHLVGIGDPTGEFFHMSSMWDCQRRRILNCRNFSFHSPTEDVSPSAAIEDAMGLLLEVQETSLEENIVSFLDATAKLKDVNVHLLEEDQRLAFFLNMYHLMVMHATLLLGPSDTGLELARAFEMVSYQVSDDVFNLLELEHCIVRSPMSSPSNSPAALRVPKGFFIDALIKPDFRINFALNNGSTSNVSSVVIYKADILELQLETVSLMFLEQVQIERIEKDKYSISLPAVCQWYAHDFGSSGSVMGLLEKIERYFDGDRLELLQGAIQAGISNIEVFYLPFSFACRSLTLENTRKRRSMKM